MLHVSLALLHVSLALLHVSLVLLHVSLALLHVSLVLLHVSLALLHVSLALLHVSLVLLQARCHCTQAVHGGGDARCARIWACAQHTVNTSTWALPRTCGNQASLDKVANHSQ